MKINAHGASAVALLLGTMLSPAAMASCPAKTIVGTWDDQFGSVARITSETKGTATASSIVCSTPGTVYTLAISLVGGPPPTTAKVVARPPKGNSCPIVKATLKYEKGSCTVAKGPIVVNGTKIEDTWTKQAAAVRPPLSPMAHDPSLSNGLK